MLNMIKYTKLFLMSFAMAFVINVSYTEGAGAGAWTGNGPNSNIVWFTTQPPADLDDVPAATLVPVTTGLRYGKTYFFNIYVKFDAGGNTFWYINSSGVAVECTPDVDCASDILTVYASSFLACVDLDLLSTGYIYPEKLPDQSSANGWFLDPIRCSDSDTCEGKALGPASLATGAEPGGSGCKGNLMASDWGSTQKQLVSPLFFDFNFEPNSGARTVEDWIADATIGVRVTATRSEPPQR